MRILGTRGIAIVALLSPPLWLAARQQAPAFRAATELVVIDTRVVGRDGAPVTGLKPDQFEVFIDGRRRPVVQLEFVRADESAAISAPAGRVIVLAVDEASVPASAPAAAREAATRVLDRVAPSDFLGLIAFPSGTRVAPTRDRSPMREAIARISGVRSDIVGSRFNVSASEAAVLKSRTPGAVKEIVDRECRQFPPDPVCPQELIQEGGRIADGLEQQGLVTIGGLHGAIESIAPLPGRKTLMVISAGLPLSSRPGSRPNLDGETAAIARQAAAANINLYVLYMNVHFLRYFSPEYGKKNNAMYEDIALFGYGLEKFADGAGGSFFQVEVDADPFVDRALRETSALYLVGVRSQPADHDGNEHFVRLTVKERGATVRYRRVVIIPAPPR